MKWKATISYFKQLKEFFGEYVLSEITPALIDDFRQMRKKQGGKPATINRQFKILRRMLNLAKQRWQWIKETPTIEMEPNADSKRIRHLSFGEYNKLLDYCNGWLKNIVVVAAWTGLRKSNVLYLMKSQINCHDKTIAVDGGQTKNGEHLVIPIAEPAYKVILAALQEGDNHSPYVFCDEDDKPYKSSFVYSEFVKSVKKAGIKDFRFHDLRHCFASWNRQAAVDLDTLAELMGHKNTQMTRRYAHITPVHLARAVGLLEKSYQAFSTNLAQ